MTDNGEHPNRQKNGNKIQGLAIKRWRPAGVASRAMGARYSAGPDNGAACPSAAAISACPMPARLRLNRAAKPCM